MAAESNGMHRCLDDGDAGGWSMFRAGDQPASGTSGIDLRQQLAAIAGAAGFRRRQTDGAGGGAGHMAVAE